jgi:NADH dehydrogenase FAD-containing subunit
LSKRRLARDDAERKRLLTFVIIGGGPTGVETQVTAIGPLGLEYREAQDDPRKAAHSNSRV